MGDFLRAEWKTLLITVLLLGLVYFLFIDSYTRTVRTDLRAEQATLHPGKDWEPIALGMSRDQVVELLGHPTRTISQPFGVQRLEYDSGWRLYLLEDAVTAVGKTLDTAGDGVLRSTLPITQWNRVKSAFGSPVYQLTPAENERYIRYPRGIAARFKGDAEDPFEVYVVPP